MVTTLATVALLAGCSASDPEPPATAATSSTSEAMPNGPADGLPEVTDEGTSGPATEVPVVDATEIGAATEPRPPVQVTLAELGIQVPVDPVGVAADGQMKIPEDALRAGWYRFGPGPGQPGVTVVAAHAGSYVTPRGPFYELTQAEAGMRIEVALESDVVVYEVVDVEILTKEGLDLAPYFDREGESRLVLITCGGVWDDSAQSYLSNVIVTARLVGG